MLSITPTKLSDYLTCPYKYKLRYLGATAESSGVSAPLSFGKTIHKALEELHKSKNQVTTPPDVADLLTKHWDAAGYLNSEEDELYFIKGCQALKAYCEVYYDCSEKTLGTEVYMSYVLKLDELQVRLGCKADRISVHPDNTLELIDYKTNASGRVATLEFLSNDLPTFLYYILTRVTYPEYKKLQITFLNVLTLAKVSVKYTPSEIVFNKSVLSDVLVSLARNYYPPKPSDACAWCSFQDSCSAVNKIIDFAEIT